MDKTCFFLFALLFVNLHSFVGGELVGKEIPDIGGGVTNKEWEAVAVQIAEENGGKSPHCLTPKDMISSKHTSQDLPPPPGGGGGPPGGGGSSSATLCPTSMSSMGISIKIDATTVTIKGTGCPGYDWTSQSTPNKARAVCSSLTVPRAARINNAPYYIGIWKTINTNITKNSSTVNYNTNNPYYYGSGSIKGPVGIAVNGINLYSNADGENRDAYFFEATTFDTCRGHPNPGSDYHYHAYTNCTGQIDTAGQHSLLMGVMADGIPIYGPLGDNGVAPNDLDECNGHTDQTYSFYHYHVPAQWNTYPYLVNCLKGCLTSTNLPGGHDIPSCVSNKTYDYSSVWSVFQAKAAANPISATGLCVSFGYQQAVVNGFSVLFLIALFVVLF